MSRLVSPKRHDRRMVFEARADTGQVHFHCDVVCSQVLGRADPR
jgi:hypothetical protein